MQVKKSSPFADLANKPGEAAKIADRVYQMIMGSFATDASRAKASGTNARQTMSEGKRRFGILERWFKTLRGDLGFSLARTLDELPRVLRSELDGIPYVPNIRNMWAG